MMWDLLLYVPTVTVLLSMAAKFWFGGDINLSYLLLFLGSFFLIAGANRILKTRLMLLPSAPVAIEVKDKNGVAITLRGGERIELLKDVKFYPDYSGRSFGLSGMDGQGRKMQLIFHKGQFPAPEDYENILAIFRG